MLHEILLSLSGHPSPLLDPATSPSSSMLSPSERALLSDLGHLSELHQKLLLASKECAHHPSPISRSISHYITDNHLRNFQTHILSVESSILSLSPDAVGAYNIVPLTYLVREFSPWVRKMERLLEVLEMLTRGTKRGGGKTSSARTLLEMLRAGLKTGFSDLEEMNLGIVEAAERAWLRGIVGWVCFGRLPDLGKEEFFVEEIKDEEGLVVDYKSEKEMLPSFVTAPTAASLLFIGRSLNHIRTKGMAIWNSPDLDLLPSHLQQFSSLSYPINSAHFTRVIASIRLSLSQSTLQKLLPLRRVVEALELLREFFLLRRGEFAIALIHEADEKITSRWRRADNLSYEKREGISNIVVKDGEVSTVLARTWAALGAVRAHVSDDEDEDELLELARDLIQLNIDKTKGIVPLPNSLTASYIAQSIAPTPFRNLLLSIPVGLSLRIPSPLDLFLTPSDIQTYSSINAYLLAIRRAHLRLTDLWKVTPLRREHPSPPGPPYGSSNAGREKVQRLRDRAKARARIMRSVWATSSAAVFFLGETETYLQGEVVQGHWEGFRTWLVRGDVSLTARPQSSRKEPVAETDDDDTEDIWLQEARSSSPSSSKSQQPQSHDSQTLANSHTLYLAHLVKSLLLTQPNFTDALYTLLLQIDHLVALVHRIHATWHSMDLEADEGVVDAFSDFGKEESQVRTDLHLVAEKVRKSVQDVVKVLGGLDAISAKDFEEVGAGGNYGDDAVVDTIISDAYRPARVGRLDRLLMKLDFGGWF